MSKTASSYKAKLISSVYMRKVRQGPTLRPSGSYSIVIWFSRSPSTIILYLIFSFIIHAFAAYGPVRFAEKSRLKEPFTDLLWKKNIIPSLKQYKRTGHGLGKYAVAQSTETGKIQSNKRKEKNDLSKSWERGRRSTSVKERKCLLRNGPLPGLLHPLGSYLLCFSSM